MAPSPTILLNRRDVATFLSLVAAAAIVYEKAMARGIGMKMNFSEY